MPEEASKLESKKESPELSELPTLNTQLTHSVLTVVFTEVLIQEPTVVLTEALMVVFTEALTVTQLMPSDLHTVSNGEAITALDMVHQTEELECHKCNNHQLMLPLMQMIKKKIEFFKKFVLLLIQGLI